MSSPDLCEQTSKLCVGFEARCCVYALVIVSAAAVGIARIATVTHPYVNREDPHGHWLNYSPLLSANDRSRWCMVYSLAEQGTFQIDEIIKQPGWKTVDHVYKDGHFYSTKPPLLQVIVAGLYRLIARCTGWTLLDHTHEVVRTILLIVNWVPMVVSLILIAWVGECYSQSDWTRIYLVCAAAWGTFLSTFVVTLNNHSLAAFCVLYATVAILRILAGESLRWLFCMAGLAAGLATAFELPSAIFILGSAALLGRTSPARLCLYFLPMASLPVLAHVVTNYLETGGLKPFYAYYGTEYYNYELNGRASYWSNPTGIDRGMDSFPVYLLNITIGHHGILSLTPCFLLTLIGWLRHRPKDRLSSLQTLTWVQTVVVLNFYLLQTANYNYGGRTSGLRWMFWLIPLWLIGMIPALDRWSTNRRLRYLSLVLLAVSVFSANWANSNPWSHPWIFVWWESVGWTNYEN